MTYPVLQLYQAEFDAIPQDWSKLPPIGHRRLTRHGHVLEVCAGKDCFVDQVGAMALSLLAVWVRWFQPVVVEAALPRA